MAAAPCKTIDAFLVGQQCSSIIPLTLIYGEISRGAAGSRNSQYSRRPCRLVLRQNCTRNKSVSWPKPSWKKGSARTRACCTWIQQLLPTSICSALKQKSLGSAVLFPEHSGSFQRQHVNRKLATATGKLFYDQGNIGLETASASNLGGILAARFRFKFRTSSCTRQVPREHRVFNQGLLRHFGINRGISMHCSPLFFHTTMMTNASINGLFPKILLLPPSTSLRGL